jgi:hypothetical protein
MEPFTECIEELKSKYNKPRISYIHYKVDLSRPENIHLLNLDIDFITEGYNFHLKRQVLGGFYYTNLIDRTKEEVIHNLSMPIDQQTKLNYIKYVIDSLNEIEGSIIYKENTWTFNKATYRGFRLNDIPKPDREYFSTIMRDLKNSLRNIIRFVSSKLPIENNTTPLIPSPSPNPKKQKSVDWESSERFQKNKSFEINPGLYESESEWTDMIKNFKESLLENGLIDQIDLRDFTKIFQNKEIPQPIVWKGKPNELYYLIRELHKRKIIKPFKNYWEIACQCFLAKKRDRSNCTPYFLQRCKAPTKRERVRILMSIISTLE